LKELKIKLKFLTPAFLGGADGITAELRPPSIKGMLRFWWRATRGGDPEMKAREAEIFGDAGDVGRTGAFSIQIRSDFSGNSVSKEYLPRNNHTQYMVKGHQLNILEYLAYGTYTYQKNQKRNVFHREYVKPGFGFELIFRFPEKATEKTIEELYRALTLWLLFGGLGARSRNGFGSLAVEGASGHPVLGGLIRATPAGEFKKLVTVNVDWPDFSAFSKRARLFKTKEVYSSWDACLARLGHAYREARLSLENKHNYNLRQFLGAPIIVNKRQISILGRRAKPYFLRVRKEKGGYAGYILYLPCRYCSDEHPELLKSGYSREKADEEFARVCERVNKHLSSKLEEIK
jgi:CRISPR-associated protein Cmr1